MGKMRGLVAIVTGASRGLGRAIAREFAREGAKVVICARPVSPTGLLGTIQETAEFEGRDTQALLVDFGGRWVVTTVGSAPPHRCDVPD